MTNNKIKTTILILIILIFGINCTFSQENVEFHKENFPNQKKEFNQAVHLIKKGDKCFEYQLRGKYLEALDYYLRANSFNPNNALLNYKIGVCYNNSLYRYNALYYLETAKKLNPNVAEDIDYNLGMAYQFQEKYDEAIEAYNNYLKQLPKSKQKYIKPVVEKLIKECEYGKDFVKNKTTLHVNNLGNKINSMWDDYAPIVSKNDSILAFTSRRKPPAGNKKNPYDYLYFEDVYFSLKDESGEWSEPFNAGRPINSSKNDGCVSFSDDGKIITLYKNKGNDEYLFESKYENNKWSKPVKLERQINIYGTYVNAATYSSDRNTIYFTSDEKRGFGGLDIYYCEKRKNGQWGRAVNMGKKVNTPYDEDAVFLANDSTLFFSSRGHNSMGSFDIFYTQKKNGEWTEPVNVGYPMNSPAMDMFLYFNGNGDAYFASDRQGGEGGMDIYFVKYSLAPEKIITDIKPVAIFSEFIDETTNNRIPFCFKAKEAENEKVIFEKHDDPSGKTEFYLTSAKNYFWEIYLQNCKDISNNNTSFFGTQYTTEYKPGNRKDDKVNPTYVKGYILNQPSNTPLQPTIEVFDITNNKNVATIIPDNNGYFEIVLPSENEYQFIYKIDCDNKNIATATDNVNYAKSIIDGKTVLLENIYFDFDKYNIRPDAMDILKRHAGLLKEYKDWKISVEGHTDNMGSPNYNYILSKNRANAAAEFLVNNGIKRSRISIKAFGYDRPAVPNTTEEQRQLNRRVEFKVYK